MKKSFVAFCRRNLAVAKLAIVSNLEYRTNFLIDAIVQPLMTTGIEILLWIAIFKGAQSIEIAGFTREYYLSYALWAAFFARIAASWMYEFRMVQEIDSGSINGLLVRPMSFYEYYFSQLMGYKFITTTVSMMVPLSVAYFVELPTIFSRFPVAIFLCLYYLILVHSISFVITCCAFYLNRISSVTVAKNMALWVLTGELFPLDLLPENIKNIAITLPFASGVYIPVGYLTGRVDSSVIQQGFISVSIALVIVNLFGAWFWNKGLRTYAGTGA